MKVKIDDDGDVVFVIESLVEAEIISKHKFPLLCECGFCGETYWNDEGLIQHIREHQRECMKRHFRQIL